MSKFKEFLNKAKDIAPEILGVAGNVLTGNIGGAVKEVGNILQSKAEKDAKAQELYLEWQMNEKEFEKELYAMELKDKQDARAMQVEALKQQDMRLHLHLHQ